MNRCQRSAKKVIVKTEKAMGEACDDGDLKKCLGLFEQIRACCTKGPFSSFRFTCLLPDKRQWKLKHPDKPITEEEDKWWESLS